jgi:hypothetical protein
MREKGERRGGGTRMGEAGAPRTEAHNTRDHRSESNCESKSETRRDRRVIKHNIRQKEYAST